MRLRGYNDETVVTSLGTRTELPFVEFSGVRSLYSG